MQGPRPAHNFQHNYQNHGPLGFQGQQHGGQSAKNRGKMRSQSFEDQMLTYMSENKRILNLHEQKFVDIAVFQTNTIVFQTNTKASLNNLEIPVGCWPLLCRISLKTLSLVTPRKIQKTAWPSY